VTAALLSVGEYKQLQTREEANPRPAGSSFIACGPTMISSTTILQLGRIPTFELAMQLLVQQREVAEAADDLRRAAAVLRRRRARAHPIRHVCLRGAVHVQVPCCTA